MKHKNFKRRAYSEFDIRLESLRLASAQSKTGDELLFNAKNIELYLKQANQTHPDNPEEIDTELLITVLNLAEKTAQSNIGMSSLIGNAKSLVKALKLFDADASL